MDDDGATRQLIASVLDDFGVEVFEAGTDTEGYQRYLEVGPDLVFVDVLLPRYGGLDLLRRIRAVRGGKEVPVLVMSAVYRGADIRSQAVEELGAVDFLKKPFQLDVLRERVAGVLADEGGGEGEGEAVNPFALTEVLHRGSLNSVDYPVLLKDLAFHKTTGCLNLRHGRSKKILFFKDGEIVFAVANQLRETLGRYLLSRGQIDEETYREALDAIREGRKMGEFLLEKGLMEPRSLFEAVRENVLAKILDVFGWQGGDFRITPYREPPAMLPGQPFEVHRVLWDGVRRHLPRERIDAALHPYRALHLVSQRDLFDLATEVPLEKEDLQFLRVLRRSRGSALGQVLAEGRGEHEVRFLYYLLLRGYVTLARGEWAGVAVRDVDAADLERIRRARRRLDGLRNRNYFQVLEVPLDTTDEKVREAYLHKAKDVHPDMLGAQDPPELQRLHAETFHVIQAAYEALKTETRRREYLKFIEEGLEEEVTDGSRILEAETLFQQGRMLLKRRSWDAAAEALDRALDLNPDEGEYALYLGIARMRQAAAGRPEALPEAEELFQRARSQLPNSPEPYYRLGRLATLRGDLDRAAAYYQGALARSPNHVESLRELRLIKMRMDKRPGVLGSLWGKKERS
ncbi:MAG: hypothetical protein Kow0092_12880 [Deferrisomatales bacterium]